jgi:Tfp pilus assembly protein PilN
LIEINLSPREKEIHFTNFGGVNLSLISVKMMLIAFILLYVPEIFMNDYYDNQIASVEAEVNSLQREKRKINVQLKKVKEIENQVEVLNNQERELKQKIKVVEKIVAKRQNPFKILKYVAENTPRDVWVKEIKLVDNDFEMIGYTTSWKSMGDFFENLKNSIFFSNSMEFNQNGDAKNKYGQRVENFTIKTKIERFE